MITSLAFGMPGTPELIIIAIIIVVLFGTTKLPKLGASVGEGIRNFKRGMREVREEEEREEAKKLEAEKAAKEKEDKAEMPAIADESDKVLDADKEKDVETTEKPA